MHRLPIICGPTSTGKTALAMVLCKKLNADIISADSRQVVTSMDIGTGKLPMGVDTKITKGTGHWVIDGVTIWGYDLVNPEQYFSGYDFAKFALQKTKELVTQNKQVIVAGGTGFYIDLFTGRITPTNVAADLTLRAELEALSIEDLSAQLKILNPEIFPKTDIKNKVRLVRAVERELTEQQPSKPLEYLADTEFVYIGLTAPRDYLYHKVDAWLDYVWEHGLLDETKILLVSSYSNSHRLRGLVYKSAVSFIQKELSEQEAKTRAKFDLHAYIRRQQTWFNKNPHIKWFDLTQFSIDAIVAEILDAIA